MSTSREHWHTRATQLAQLDAWLLELVGDDQVLSKLRSDVYAALLRKIDELVGEACRQEAADVDSKGIECELAKAIWNFLRPWKGSTHVPRGTNTKQTIGASAQC